MFKFEKLNVWKKSIEFCSQIFTITNKLPRDELYSLSDQLKRSSLSIPNNIAESSGRRFSKEQKQLFNVAKGSTYETLNLLIIAKRRGYIDENIFKKLYEDAEEIAKMLSGLMKREGI